MSSTALFASTSPSRPLADAAALPAPGFVTGAPRLLLRGEGALVLLAGVLAYRHFGYGWGWFAALFLVPDLSLLAYLFGPRVGAVVYNSAHTYGAVAVLAALGAATGHATLFAAAGLWLAHIGFDRMLGYGLKYATAFGATHLGTVGA